MITRSYASPLAFKTAVERRLNNDASASGMNLNRRRQLFVFDRYLARVFNLLEDAVVLKGGMVIELRLERRVGDSVVFGATGRFEVVTSNQWHRCPID